MLHCPTSLSRMLMKEIAGNWKLPETVRDALDIIYISCNVQGYIPIAYMYVHETCTYIIHMWLYNICLKIYHQIQRKTENGVLFTLHPLPIMPLAGIFVTSLKVRKKQVVSSALRLCFLTWWLQGLCMKLFTLGDFRSPWFVSCTQNSHAGSLLILHKNHKSTKNGHGRTPLRTSDTANVYGNRASAHSIAPESPAAAPGSWLINKETPVAKTPVTISFIFFYYKVVWAAIV